MKRSSALPKVERIAEELNGEETQEHKDQNEDHKQEPQKEDAQNASHDAEDTSANEEDESANDDLGDISQGLTITEITGTFPVCSIRFTLPWSLFSSFLTAHTPAAWMASINALGRFIGVSPFFMGFCDIYTFGWFHSLGWL